MKKIVLPMFAFALSFIVLNAQADELKGKVVAKKGDAIHVVPNGSATPTSLKVTPQTKYFEKEQKKSAENADIMAGEFVEVIYSMDPKTKEPVIDEIIVVDFID